MNKLIALVFAAILIAGCTESSSSNVDLSALEDLSDLPSINASGMPELGSLPSTNTSISLDTGMPSENPFPSEPLIE